MQLKTSVRNLVEFLMRSGSIDNRHAASSDDAMAEGGRIHRMIQRRMGSDYQAEVTLRYTYHTDRYDIIIEGRADGVITESGGFTIDEIKATYRDVAKIEAAIPVHLAQAKCYAYMYAMRQRAAEEKMTGQSLACDVPALWQPQQRMKARLTYCNMDTEEIRYFYDEYTFEELERWFHELLEQYRKWADLEFDWKEKRQQSIRALAFPFPYRKGQKELASYVYQTICHKRKLFLEAPTGVGKTISTVFPAVKALGEGKADRIFYLTAKTVTRAVAQETFSLLRERGLAFKTVLLSARDKICFLEETDCNPQACAYADGHFDRINEALYDILTHEVNYSREVIEEYARKYRVCPFEMGLDISLFCDGIICDYNYVFDPHVYLRRFFGGNASGDYLFLIDEAHNLVERGREMYSASLWKEDFLELKRKVKAVDAKIARYLDQCNKELLTLKRECETYRVVEMIAPFVMALTRLHGSLNDFLEAHKEHDPAGIRGDILEFYFAVSHFLEMYELMDDHYVSYTKMEDDGRFLIRLFCVNPALNLRECMNRGKSTILFSATLLPIQYYKRLLGGEPEDYEVYAESVFDRRRCGLFAAGDVTTRYTRRGEEEYRRIARYIYETVKNRYGNYMVFFPSYSFLQHVYEIYIAEFQDKTQECIVQEGHMNERAKEEFLGRFSVNVECDFSDVIHMEVEIEEEKSLLGFCVMGGVFGEGIDLKNDSLIGAIIVGTGIPQVCAEREILKRYFDGEYRQEAAESTASGLSQDTAEIGTNGLAKANGFDFAYRYPGMNKVLQAAGRVIRTAQDVGIVVLLDERFHSPSYRRLFPREWESCEWVDGNGISRRIERFWDEWL
ncbi:MAG: ATP-dependent DNA helicase [Lachnospiraceae bacterium]|nr:ATP-dependent DNA helicase [Lachnospiraceae bacterium]